MNITIRRPKIEDGKQIWNLIHRTGNLDLNSEYCYFMLSDLFRQQCAVICSDEEAEILGFASCILRPDSPKTLFVWQICIDQKLQKRGLAKRVLKHIIENQDHRVEYVEATISEDNTSSRALFSSLAKDYHAPISKDIYIESGQFNSGHESEFIYTIGKLKY